MLEDRYNRVHDYLRISLTDACNFRCIYCMPDENMSFLKKKFLMSPQEIFSIARVFTNLGVKKIRLTGGEPLVRDDFGAIVSQLSLLPVQLGITTNGLLLDRWLPDILEAGIGSLNISIDSLKRERFNQITQRQHFDKVWENIHLSIEKGIHVKLNIVMMRHFNEDEVDDFIALTKNLPIHIRFIEFMPFSQNNWNKDKVISNQEILSNIQEKYALFKLKDGSHDTDKKFGIFGHSGTICFISTLTEAFCSTCNRMRLTADGKMKNCLFGKDEWDLLTAFRTGEDIEPIIRNAVMNKHEKLGGQFDDYQKIDPRKIVNRSMIKIGG